MNILGLISQLIGIKTLRLTPRTMTNDKPELSSVPVVHVQSENPSFTTNVILTETNYDV